MVSQQGVKANPNKIKVILEMALAKNIKEVQSLSEKVAALNKFIFQETKKCLLFFKMLKKAFEWTNDVAYIPTFTQSIQVQ